MAARVHGREEFVPIAGPIAVPLVLPARFAPRSWTQPMVYERVCNIAERMSEAPTEWVEGDPTWSRAFTALSCGIPLACAFYIAVLVLTWLWSSGAISSTPLFYSFPWWPAGSLALSLAVFIIVFLPLQRPVIRRVGISQNGLVLRYGFRTFRIPWSEAVWFTPYCVSSRRWSMARFLLTPHQSERIYAWWYPPVARAA